MTSKLFDLILRWMYTVTFIIITKIPDISPGMMHDISQNLEDIQEEIGNGHKFSDEMNFKGKKEE